AHVLRVIEVEGSESLKVLTQGRVRSTGRTGWLQDAIDESVGKVAAERQPVVVGDDDRRRLREARLEIAENNGRHRVHAPATAYDCLVGQRIDKSGARLEVVAIRVVKAAVVVGRELNAALRVEGGNRKLGDGAARVRRAGGGGDGSG